jgi:hypothetical protein
MNRFSVCVREAISQSSIFSMLTPRQPARRRVFLTFVALIGIGITCQPNRLQGASVNLYGTQFVFPANLYSVNTSTGAATVIANTGSFDPGLAYRKSNGILYGSSSSLDTFNIKTGKATTIASLPDLIVSIAFSPTDQLYGVNNSGDTLFRLDPHTGAALASVPLTGTVHPSGSPFIGEINGIDFAPDGTLYGVGFALYSIDALTGVATRITPLGTNVTGGGAGFLFDDIDYGADGVLRGVTSGAGGVNSNLYTINTNTGIGTLVGLTGVSMDGLASIPTPEPSGIVLIVIGAASVRFVSRRNFSASAQKTNDELATATDVDRSCRG